MYKLMETSWFRKTSLKLNFIEAKIKSKILQNFIFSTNITNKEPEHKPISPKELYSQTMPYLTQTNQK